MHELNVIYESQNQKQQANMQLHQQRQEEKRKIQEAIYLSKVEEVKQTKQVKK